MNQSILKNGRFIVFGAISGFVSYAVLWFFFLAIGSPTMLLAGWMLLIFSIGLGAVIGYLFKGIGRGAIDFASAFAIMVIAFALSIVADFLLLVYLF